MKRFILLLMVVLSLVACSRSREDVEKALTNGWLSEDGNSQLGIIWLPDEASFGYNGQNYYVAKVDYNKDKEIIYWDIHRIESWTGEINPNVIKLQMKLTKKDGKLRLVVRGLRDDDLKFVEAKLDVSAALDHMVITNLKTGEYGKYVKRKNVKEEW